MPTATGLTALSGYLHRRRARLSELVERVNLRTA